MKNNVIIIGIGGCSRCGKTKLINQYLNLNKLNSHFCNISYSIHLDRYFNKTKISKNLITTKKGNTYRNWEFPGALNWDDFYAEINNKLKEMNETIKNNLYYKIIQLINKINYWSINLFFKKKFLILN